MPTYKNDVTVLVRILGLMGSSKPFCAGIICDEFGFPVYFAPYLKFMRDWHLDKVKAYCLRRGWQIEVYAD